MVKANLYTVVNSIMYIYIPWYVISTCEDLWSISIYICWFIYHTILKTEKAKPLSKCLELLSMQRCTEWPLFEGESQRPPRLKWDCYSSVQNHKSRHQCSVWRLFLLDTWVSTSDENKLQNNLLNLTKSLAPLLPLRSMERLPTSAKLS